MLDARLARLGGEGVRQGRNGVCRGRGGNVGPSGGRARRRRRIRGDVTRAGSAARALPHDEEGGRGEQQGREPEEFPLSNRAALRPIIAFTFHAAREAGVAVNTWDSAMLSPR